MPFDPDAYLAARSKPAFDPDAYLASKGESPATAQYLVTGPDGTKYRVTGPAGASDEDVISQVKTHIAPHGEGPWTKYANKAPASGGFDPDAYLASQGQPTPPDTRSAIRKVADVVNAPSQLATTMASSLIAGPVADVAGLAATGYEFLAHGAHGDSDAPSGFRDYVRDRLTYHPDSVPAQRVLQGVGNVASPIADAGGRIADAARGDAPGNSPRGMLTNAAIEGLKQAPGFLGLKGAQQFPKVASAVERGTDTLMGTTAKAAKGEALTATRGALGEVEQGHAATQAAKMTEAQAYEDAAARAQSELRAAAQRTGTPTVDVIGEQVRSDYLGAMTDAKAARAKEVAPLYAKAKAAAAAREAQGQFIDVKPALSDIDAMLKDSKHLPDLHAKLLRLRQSVEGSAPKAPEVAPPGRGKVTSTMRTPTPPAAPARPLSYAQLDESTRYIKDIAFSGEAEGYGALIRNTARRLSVKLDEQIAKSVPEHAAATAKYRELSEPMETLSTRIGAALHDTEGGLKGDAYGKVPTQDLPSRIFSRKDRVEQLVDSLAGGKNATPQARAAAQAKVDTWVENWILDTARGKVGAEAAREIAAPGMRATLNAAPGARERLVGTFGREEAAAARVPELGRAAEAARTEAHAAQTQRVKVRAAIEQADVDLAHGSQDVAYRGYVTALRQSMGAADAAKYRAAIALIERAGTLDAKTAKAQKLARHFVYGATAAAGFNEGRKLLQ